MGAFLAILAILCIVIGIVGTIVPLIPGIPIAFAAVLLYGWYDGFVHIEVQYLIIIGVLTVLSVVIDYITLALGSKLFGATNKSAVGSVVGSIIGIFVFPPLGILLFALLGAMVVEFYLSHDIMKSLKAGLGSAVGFFSSTLFKLMMGLGILFSFIVKII